MASVHLSISKHTVIFRLHRRRGPFFLPLHGRPLTISAPAFSLVSFIYSPPLLLYRSPLAFIFSFSSILLLFLFHSIPSFLHCSSSSPALSVEQPIQQQNKAAHSITHWLIKQDQNAAALTSTQHRHDTGQHWQRKVEENKCAQDNVT